MDVNVLIASHSRTGSTEALAQAIAEGAHSCGSTLRLRPAREVADAATIAGLPGWAEAAVRMNASYEAPTADNAEWADAIALGTMYQPLAHPGLIIVPLGYADPTLFRAGTPYGASSVSGQSNTAPTADDWKWLAFRGGESVPLPGRCNSAALYRPDQTDFGASGSRKPSPPSLLSERMS